jgi:hypothetical protein
MSYTTLRSVHGVLALGLATSLVLYLASGWMIIHNIGGGEAATQATESVSVAPIGGESEAVSRVEAAAVEAAERAGLAGARTRRVEFVEGVWRVKLARVARSAEVTLTPGAQQARVALRDGTLAEGIKQLHHLNALEVSGGRLAWAILIDALSIALLLFAVTGLWLFVRLKRDRRLGWTLLGASSLYTLVGIAWYALSR